MCFPWHVKDFIYGWDGVLYKEVEKDVNKVVDEDNVVDKKLNEGSQLKDMVMVNAFKRFFYWKQHKH